MKCVVSSKPSLGNVHRKVMRTIFKRRRRKKPVEEGIGYERESRQSEWFRLDVVDNILRKDGCVTSGYSSMDLNLSTYSRVKVVIYGKTLESLPLNDTNMLEPGFPAA